MSTTRELCRESWRWSLELISQLTLGQAVRIEISDPEMGDQELARGVPLAAIELDTKGSERGDIEIAIDISLREKKGGLFLHHVDKPTHVFLEENDAGEIECMEIEDANGGKLLLYFTEPFPLPPEGAQPPA